MTDKVQKIREEVEKLRIKNTEAFDCGCDGTKCAGYDMACDDILSFIDSLQEEPVSEDMVDAAESLVMSQEDYDKVVDECIFDAYIDSLQEEPVSDELEEEPTDDIEAYQSRWGKSNGYLAEPVNEDLNDEIRKYFLSYKGYPHVMDETERKIKKAIIYFANWQKQQTVNKACKWLEENIEKYICADGEWNIDWNFINDFKKYMEG